MNELLDFVLKVLNLHRLYENALAGLFLASPHTMDPQVHALILDAHVTRQALEDLYTHARALIEQPTPPPGGAQ